MAAARKAAEMTCEEVASVEVAIAVLALACIGLAVGFGALEAQLRSMALLLEERRRRGGTVRLTVRTKGTVALAREANELIREVEETHLLAAQERQALQEDLAAFSHDVRTPLAGAQGYLQLYAVADEGAERDECVAQAGERLAAMRQLVDGLFEYAKAEDGELSLALCPVDVGEVVRTCMAELRPLFEQRGWCPYVRVEGEPVALADPEALARIVQNLLVNCLRHGSGAPIVELRAVDASGFSFAVSNPAEGLEAVDAARVFERFYRGDASRRSGGSGLGLSIAANLAAAMGLTLNAAVTEGTFSITMCS